MAESIYMQIGDRIRSLRKRHKLSQDELGKKLQPPVTRTCVANIELGKQRILAHTVVQLADILRCRADELLASFSTGDERLREDEFGKRQRQRDKKRIGIMLRSVIGEINRMP